MREIEAKIIDVNEKALLERLKELGAKKVASRRMNSIYFDFPDKRLEKNKAILRIRLDGKKAIMCVKKKTRQSKLKDLKELEVEIADFEQAKKMFNLIGFVERAVFPKKRDSFELGKAEIVVDKMKGIPTYLEIEAPSQKIVVETAKKLGFSEKELLPWGPFTLLRHYKKLP